MAYTEKFADFCSRGKTTKGNAFKSWNADFVIAVTLSSIIANKKKIKKDKSTPMSFEIAESDI